MIRSFPRSAIVGIFFFTLSVSIGSAQGTNPTYPEGFDEPMPLYEAALGKFTRPITSTSKKAQAFFDQGIQLKYSFAIKEAARSFYEAQKHDPNSAISYWGEAWAWGRYLNGRMSSDNAPRAYAAIQKARALSKDHASPVEKALIEAMAVRYVEDYDPDTRKVQDKTYAKAMQAVYEIYPNDADVATVYAEALFLLMPRAGTRELDDPQVVQLHRVLQGVLKADIRHPGACHLYIHATESTITPELAEGCAEYLGDTIPGASHLNHMPSHTFNEIGRWGDSVRANLQAWHSDQKAAVGEGVAIYPAHNLAMLIYAASNDGQGAIAIQAAKDFAGIRNGNNRHWVLTLIRFGRFAEVLELTDQPERKMDSEIWNFAQGYAYLRTGKVDKAQEYLKRVRKAEKSSKSDGGRQHKIFGTIAGILEGEIHRESGDLNASIQSFEKAVSTEDELPWNEPEILPFSARHWLGVALLEKEKYKDAERAYREELEDHPHNGWSLFGLIKALEAQGKPIADVKRDFDASWARSDTWIHASIF